MVVGLRAATCWACDVLVSAIFGRSTPAAPSGSATPSTWRLRQNHSRLIDKAGLVTGEIFEQCPAASFRGWHGAGQDIWVGRACLGPLDVFLPSFAVLLDSGVDWIGFGHVPAPLV